MFDGYIRDHARWSPRATAVFLPGRRVSYAEFDAEIDRLGAALAGLGLGPHSGVVSVAIAAVCKAGSGFGIRWALISASLFGLVAFACFWAARKTIREETVS